jgi:hypothetical protein
MMLNRPNNSASVIAPMPERANSPTPNATPTRHRARVPGGLAAPEGAGAGVMSAITGPCVNHPSSGIRVDGAADGAASTRGRAGSEARGELDSTQGTPGTGGQKNDGQALDLIRLIEAPASR